MGCVRFVQVSDLAWAHVACLGGRLRMERAQEICRVDQRRVLDSLIRLCEEYLPHLVLVAGNLIDDSWATPDLADELSRGLARLAPARVLVSPGDLDPPHGAGYLRPGVLELLKKTPLPANVTIFESLRPQVVSCGEVCVIGWASLMSNDSPGGATREAAAPEGFDRVLGMESSRGADHRILLGHTLPRGARTEAVVERMAAGSILYAALGDRDGPYFLKDRTGAIRAGWAGHPVVRAIPGGKGVLLRGEITADGEVLLHQESPGTRRAHLVECSVVCADDERTLAERLKVQFDKARVGREDVVHLRLTGAWSGCELPAVETLLSGWCGDLLVETDTLVLGRRTAHTVRDLHLSALASRVGPVRRQAMAAAAGAWGELGVNTGSEDPSGTV